MNEDWGSWFRGITGSAAEAYANSLDPNAKSPAADRRAVETADKIDWKVIGIGALVLLVVAIVVKKLL